MKRIVYAAVAIACSLSFTHCATICGGSKYYAHVVVNDKPNAKIMYEGYLEGTGKAVISVKRADAKRFAFTVQQEGCSEQRYQFKSRTFRGWALGGTIITWSYFGIPVGVVVDLATGALWKPNVYERGIKKLDFKNFKYTVDYTASCTAPAKTNTHESAKDAKEQAADILYLKNGTIVRGMIIENTPNKQVQIRVEGGDIVLYPSDEIGRVEKESIAE
ncbi:MAG TPA: hypothetical protein VL092_04500 [Chitinophagaceae bacterium]|nr:hypothetical protein [Chitinophagaceae bacterium]